MSAVVGMFFVSFTSLGFIVLSVLMRWLCFMIVMFLIMLLHRMILLIHISPCFIS